MESDASRLSFFIWVAHNQVASSIEPYDGGSRKHSGEEVSRGFVGTGRYGAALFEIAKENLRQTAPYITPCHRGAVFYDFSLVVFLWWYDGVLARWAQWLDPPL